MLELAHGRGRSASRWIAMAMSVEPRWSPAAGSSLQLTASRTRTPLSKMPDNLTTKVLIDAFILCSCIVHLQILRCSCMAGLHGNASDDFGEQRCSHKTNSENRPPSTVRPVHLWLWHCPSRAQRSRLLQWLGAACVHPGLLTHLYRRD